MVTQSFKNVLLSSQRFPPPCAIYHVATYVPRRGLTSEYTTRDILIDDYGGSDAAAVVAHVHNTLRRLLEEDARRYLKRDTPCISSLFRILDHESRPFFHKPASSFSL